MNKFTMEQKGRYEGFVPIFLVARIIYSVGIISSVAAIYYLNLQFITMMQQAILGTMLIMLVEIILHSLRTKRIGEEILNVKKEIEDEVVSYIGEKVFRLEEKIDNLVSSREVNADVAEKCFSALILAAEEVAAALYMTHLCDSQIKNGNFERGHEYNYLAINKLLGVKISIQAFASTSLVGSIDEQFTLDDKHEFASKLIESGLQLRRQVVSWGFSNIRSSILLEEFENIWTESAKNPRSIYHYLNSISNSIDDIIDIRRGKLPEPHNSPTVTMGIGAVINGYIYVAANMICNYKFECAFSGYITGFTMMSQGIFTLLGYALSDDKD